MTEHEHEWVNQPEDSTDQTHRYLCRCGAWGWRPRLDPGAEVRAYGDQAKARKEVADQRAREGRVLRPSGTHFRGPSVSTEGALPARVEGGRVMPAPDQDAAFSEDDDE